jgi:hypothetical protein
VELGVVGCGSVVKQLPSVLKVLGSIPTIERKKEKNGARKA